VKFELKPNCKYAMVVPTSMGFRLAPMNGQGVHNATSFMLQVSSAETNVATISSVLGLPVKVLTTFVKGSPLAQIIKDNLAGRHMEYEGVEVP
jgi:2-dehydro-3-deoxygluconokinase